MAKALKVLQLLRNDPVYASRTAAVNALKSTAFLANRKDGEIVVARYHEQDGTFGQVLGTIHVENNTRHIALYEEAVTIPLTEGDELSYQPQPNDNRPASLGSLINAITALQAEVQGIIFGEGGVSASLDEKQDKLTAGNGINITADNSIELNFNGSLFEVVTALPTTGTTNKIYLLASAETGEKNLYKEYVWIGDKYEQIGEFTSSVDLTPFLKKADLATSTGTSTTTSMTQKAITDALNGKQAKLTFDSAPTANSTKPVTSGGVYTAINNAKSAVLKNDALDNSTTTKAPTVKLSWQVANELNSRIKGRIADSADIVITEPITGDSSSIMPNIAGGNGAKLTFAENAVWDCGTYTTT